MATTPNYYDILLSQGQTFYLCVGYNDDNGDSVDLDGTTYNVSMQVRRSPLVKELLLFSTSDSYPNGVTGGGITGQFLGTTLDPGVNGTGGITLNYAGVTGDFRIEIDYATTANLPRGRHFYDIDVRNKVSDTVDKVMTGTFEVLSEVTR
jgi:hypothetical protein